ncbi:YqaJ viral recombinase family protein [Antribacter gilvus]|uniref:YqaJ viral recombinase family nuclease n=1 Tax=Antribacter gilvus TaxID=2304675 RepID=UPI000F79BADC|nr:YqaJ viral recombinase family protein [Antribacter gilvus]
MTASKVAAVVGTSPYESRFSLWHRMHGDLEPQPQSAEMSYGHYLEPVLLQWFADQHPELIVKPGEWAEVDGWAGASPDGRVFGKTKRDQAVVQCKTSRLAYEWETGVPPGYYDQVQWEMWVTGARRAYVAADVAMEFREYPIDRDNDRIDHLVTEARAFMDSLAAGTPPPLDGSSHTYQAIRALHPEIDPESVEVPAALAVRWLDAREVVAEATEAETLAKNEIAALMGNAQRAVWDGTTLLTRQARNGGTPYVVAARGLPSTRKAAS